MPTADELINELKQDTKKSKTVKPDEPREEQPSEVVEIKDVKRKVPILRDNRLKDAQYCRTIYVVNVEHGTRLEDMMDPSYWSNVAKRLRQKDRIEVECDDNSFWAEFMVMKAGSNYAEVQLMRSMSLGEYEFKVNNETDAYVAVFRGNYEKWGVLDRKNNSVCISGLDTEKEAMGWIDDQRRALIR